MQLREGAARQQQMRVRVDEAAHFSWLRPVLDVLHILEPTPLRLLVPLRMAKASLRIDAVFVWLW